MKRLRRILTRPLLALALLLTSCFTSSCGGDNPGMRAGLGIAARGLSMADRSFAPFYEHCRVSARETSSTWEERDGKAAACDAARDALEATHEALYGVEAALDAQAAGAEADVEGAAGCLSNAIARLRFAFDKLGRPLPRLFLQAENALGGWASICPAGGPP